MMFSLIRRDPYLQYAPFYFLFAAILAGLTAQLIEFGRLPGGEWILYANILLVISLPIQRSQTFRRRFDELQLTLPMRTEQLTRARLIAMLASCVGPLVVACAVVTIATPTEPSRLIFTHCLGLIGALALAVVVHNLLAIDSNEIRPAVWLSFLATIVVGTAGTFYFSSSFFGSLLLATAAFFGTIAWRRAPPWLPAAAESPRAGTEATHFRSKRSLLWSVLRAHLGEPAKIFSLILNWVFVPVFLFKPGGFDSNLTFAPIFAFFFYFWNRQLAQTLRVVAHLPIDRRRHALAVVLPGLLVGLLSIGAATTIAGDSWGWQKNHAALTTVEVAGEEEDDFTVDTDTPPTLWQIYFGLGRPVAVSPFAEAHELTAHRPFPMTPFALYNPYEITPDASLAFAAWQIRRLVAEAHGIDLTSDEIERRYIRRGQNGRINQRPRDPDTNAVRQFEDDFDDAALLGRTEVLYGSLFAYLIFWSAMGALAFRRRQYPRRRLMSKDLTWTWLGGAIILVFVVVPFFDLSSYHTAGVLRGAVFRSLGAWLPSSTWLAGITFGTIAAVMGMWISRLHSRMDVPPLPWVSQ